MARSSRIPRGGYVYAALGVLLATALRVALQPILGERFPFLSVFVAIVLASWTGGFGPGFLAVVLSYLAIDQFILAPNGPVPLNGVRWQFTFAFFAVGLAVAALGEARRAARRRASESDSEARRLQERQRAEQEWLRTTLASIADAVITADPDGRVTSLNPAAERLTGWPQSEAAGRPLGEVFRLVPDLDDAISGGGFPGGPRPDDSGPFGDRARLHGRGRGDRWIEHSAAPIRDATGRAGGIVIVFRDISGRRRAEAALRASEEHYRAVFDQAAVGIAEIDPEGRFARVNDRYCEIVGYAREELLGRRFREIAHPDVPAAALERLARVAEGGPRDAIELRLVRKDGHSVRARVAASQIRDGSGRPAGLLAVAEDVSERRRLEAQLEAERALLDAFFSSTTVALGLVDIQFRFLRVNQALAETNGVEADDHIGRTVAEVLPELWPTLAPLFRRVLETGEPLRNFEVEGATPKRVAGGQSWLVNYYPIRRDREIVAVGFAVVETTESRRREARLREAEERLRLAVEATGLGIWDADVSQPGVTWSDRLRAMYGLGPDDEVEVGRIRAMIHPDDLGGFVEANDAALDPRGDGTLAVEHRITRPDGETRWVAINGRCFFEGEGAARRPGRFIGTALDVTDRRNAEASVRASEERLRLALEAGRMGTWDWDLRTGRLAWSDNLEEVHGLPRGSFDGTIEGFRGLIHPEDRESVEGAIARAIEGDRDFEAEFRVARPDGSIGWMMGKGKVFADDAGRPARMIGIGIDVTARAKAEGRLRLLWEAAAVLLSTDDPDRMLRALFEQVAPHFGLDAYFNFMVDDSGAALRLVSCLGIREGDARLPERLEFGQAVCGTVAQDRRAITATRIQDSDDPMVALIRGLGLRAYTCNPLMAGETLLGTLSFATRRRDAFEADELESLRTISHYVAFAYERIRLIGRLREADRRKDEFLATLAHELRNPLAPIRTALHLMGHGGDGQDHESERAMAERQVAHLTRLVDDLMDVARINKGKIELRRRPVELAPIVAHAVESARPAFEGRGHRLAVDLPPAPIHLEADPTRLEQVLDNLLSNACKYTDPGGRISISAIEREAQVEIRVADDGIGIPPEKLAQVFEMFAQVDHRSDRSQGGLGIGLGLVKSLVELHGGTIAARSEGTGLGSEFVVCLPTLPAPPPHRPPPDGANGARDVRPARRRILVVDDNVDAAVSLARLLTRLHGQEVRVAHNGPAALDEAEAFRPEVVILDIGMPGMDGYEVARRLRSRPEFAGTELVALTGWGQESDRRRSREAGLDRHLVKPVDPEAIRALLAGIAPPEPAPSPAS